MAENSMREPLPVPDFVKEAEEQMAKEAQERKAAASGQREEVSIKFGKGLAEPFTSKDGREFTRIRIPNQDQDPKDKTPWASFVLPAKSVHENQYGKGLWAKIPADGTTVVTKPTLKGHDDKGRNIWDNVKTNVPNRELKYGFIMSIKMIFPDETVYAYARGMDWKSRWLGVSKDNPAPTGEFVDNIEKYDNVKDAENSRYYSGMKMAEQLLGEIFFGTVNPEDVQLTIPR